MTQYIDKSALVAEIEGMLQEEYPCDNSEQITGYHYALYELQEYLDTLEMKEVDLAKELDNYFAKFKGLEKSYWNWRIDSMNVHAQGIYDFAKYFFELGLKTKGE